jgi:hypothetical protein
VRERGEPIWTNGEKAWHSVGILCGEKFRPQEGRNLKVNPKMQLKKIRLRRTSVVNFAGPFSFIEAL